MIDVVDTLGAVADHRLTIGTGWALPPVIVLAAPDEFILPALFAMFGVTLVLHQAQLARGARTVTDGGADE